MSELGLALDEPQENDLIFTEQGIMFVIEKALFERAKPILIEFMEGISQIGFQITSSLPVGGGCSGKP